MPVNAAMLERFRQLDRDTPELDVGHLGALQTIAEVIGYVVEGARQDGIDEADAVELLLTDAGLDREELRANALILRRLGYIKVADVMRRLARKAKPKKVAGDNRSCRHSADTA